MITDLTEIKKLLKSKKLYAFDFDGVIADSVEIKTEAFYKLYKPYGESIAKKVINHHKANQGKSRFQKFKYYHLNYLSIKIDKENLNKLGKNFSNIIVNKVIESSEISGVNNFLENLHLLNKKCIVNTGTPKKEIVEIIKKRNLSKYFIKIYGSPTSKIDNFKSVINEFNINKRDIVYFGDSMHDLHVAMQIGIQFVGIGKSIYNVLLNSSRNTCYLLDFSEISLL